MKVIASVTNKGGDGKTKISTFIAEYFATVRNKKVLLLDLDPQCNLSNRYLPIEDDPAAAIEQGKLPPIHPDYDPDDSSWDGRSSIADIFYGDIIYPYETSFKNLDISPGSSDKLQAAEEVRRIDVEEKVHNQLKSFLKQPEVGEAYDIVVIDTRPSKGPLTRSAIKAATDIVIPAQMEAHSLDGIAGMLQLWMQERVSRDSNEEPINLVGILANKYEERLSLHKENYASLEEIPDIKKHLMPMKIGKRVKISEIDSDYTRTESVFNFSDSDKARQEVLAACEYIERSIYSHD